MQRRIAIISEHASPLANAGSDADSGGQNVYVAQVALHLAAQGHRVDVFTRRDAPGQPQVLHWVPGVRVIHVDAGPAAPLRKQVLLPYMSTFLRWMCAFIAARRLHYDVVHANFWMSGLVAAGLKRRLALPYVVTFHALGAVRRQYQGVHDDFPAARYRIERQVADEADAVIAECPQDRDDLVRFYGVAEDRLWIIPCGFSPDEFFPVPRGQARRRVGLTEDARVVLQLGRMVPRKGVDTVIQGFADYARHGAGAAVLLVVGGDGGGAELARLRRIAAEEQVADKVWFGGSRPRAELRYFYSAADVFITTPWYEPFGITPLESMACATPVIGACVGGIKHSVLHGRTGWLIPPKSPSAVAERLRYCYDRPRLMERLGGRAVHHVRRHYTWDQVVTRIAGLYDDVIAGAARPGIRAARGYAAAPAPAPLQLGFGSGG